MKSSKYDHIVLQIEEVIAKGEAGTLLQKLESEYYTKDKSELANYFLILLILLENTSYYEMTSNLLIRKILSDNKQLTIQELFDILIANKFTPYSGLSKVIGRLISTVIYNREEEKEIISKLPSRNYLTKLNVDILSEALSVTPAQENVALSLLYNCISDIEEPDKRIILDGTALDNFRNKLTQDEQFSNDYFSNFFRFYWYGGSRNHYEGKLIVPEPFYLQIFKNYDNFIIFLNERKELSSDNDIQVLISDILEFMQIYGNRSEGMPYDKLGLTIRLHKIVAAELGK